jgi:hypothetical protein
MSISYGCVTSRSVRNLGICPFTPIAYITTTLLGLEARTIHGNPPVVSIRHRQHSEVHNNLYINPQPRRSASVPSNYNHNQPSNNNSTRQDQHGLFPRSTKPRNRATPPGLRAPPGSRTPRRPATSTGIRATAGEAGDGRPGTRAGNRETAAEGG